MRKLLLTTVIALLSVAGAMAQMYDFSAVSGTNTLYYKITNASSTPKTVQVVAPNGLYLSAWDGYTKPAGTLTIPATVNNDGTEYSVTSIKQSAFFGCNGIGTLIIGENVTRILWDAFKNCGFSELKMLSTTPPNGLNAHIFKDTPLKLIWVPLGKKSTYEAATDWSVLTSSVRFIEIGEVEQISINVATAGTLSDELDVLSKDPSTVARLKLSGTLVTNDWALLKNNMPALYYLDLSEITNTTIPSEAFKDSKILFFTFPQGLEEIGNSAFSGSNLLGELNLPESLTSIEFGAFYDCNDLTGTLTIPSSVTSIGKDAFRDCNGFTGTLIIPNSVTSIGEFAFYGCYGFTGSLTIGSGLTDVSGLPMYNNFTEFIVSEDNATYSSQDGMLYNKNKTTVIDCPKDKTGTLIIPNSVTSIGDYAFSSCRGFTGTLTIPNSVTSIGEMAFFGCSDFTGTLSIGNSVTSIGERAFFGCSGFTGSLTIGNSVTSIGYMAFYACGGFTGSLTIPNSVTSIGGGGFL